MENHPTGNNLPSGQAADNVLQLDCHFLQKYKTLT